MALKKNLGRNKEKRRRFGHGDHSSRSSTTSGETLESRDICCVLSSSRNKRIINSTSSSDRRREEPRGGGGAEQTHTSGVEMGTGRVTSRREGSMH